MPASKSLLYAKRVKGDLDLALEPSRINAKVERDLARIYTPGGKLPGRSFQDIYAYDTTKNYRTGTRLVMDERVFRYAKIGDCSGGAAAWEAGKGRPTEYGAGMSSIVTTKTAASIVSGAETEFTVVVTLADAVELDDYAGGYFGLFDLSVGTLWGCRILGNSAQATPGSNVTLTLDSPLPVTLAAGDTVTITPNPYSNVVRHSGVGGPAGTCFETVVGMLMLYGLDVDRVGQWVWLQTWGPYAEPLIDVLHKGGTTYERTLWFYAGGGMQCCVADGEHLAKQRAGWYLPESAADLTHPVVWLTIAP